MCTNLEQNENSNSKISLNVKFTISISYTSSNIKYLKGLRKIKSTVLMKIPFQMLQIVRTDTWLKLHWNLQWKLHFPNHNIQIVWIKPLNWNKA